MNNLFSVRQNRIKVMIGLLLIIATLIAYWHIENFDFIDVDDELYVTENRQVQNGLTFEGIVWAFTTFHAANWHPVTWLSHMLDFSLYGLNPMGHHWTNLQFHLANSLLLLFVFFKMTGALWRSAFVAALFALHPLHVESVAWVAERKDVLSTFFGFLTIGAYYHYVQRPQILKYLLIILLFSLGLMAKPMLVTLPFVLLLLDFWPLEQFSSQRTQPHKETLQRVLQLVQGKIPLFIAVVVSSVLTFLAQQSQGAVGSLAYFSIRARISNALVSYVRYIGKAIWPQKLSIFYPYPDFTPIWQVMGAAILIAGASCLAVRYSKRYPYIAVGLFWYLGTLVPVIGLVQVGPQSMADRYTYIPLIGIFIIVAWGAWDLLEKQRWRKEILVVSATLILSILTVRTYFQVSHWKNGITVFENAVRVTENNYWAYNNLGTAYGKKNYDMAILSYNKALNIKPDYTAALFNLGTSFTEKGSFDKAVPYFNKALKIDPKDVDVHNNLGSILFIRGKLDKAALHFNEILKIDPENANAHSNLANVLSAQGKLDEAALSYEQAIKINPDHKDAYYNFGELLLKQGKINEAVAHFAKAIKIDPNYSKAYNYIGVILAQQGEIKKADMFFSKAIQIKPDYAEARENLKILKQIISKSNKP